MSEKSKPNKNKYTYKYIQFTVTSIEKKQIKHFANKENFKTTSEFVRRIVFDYIMRQENPELFIRYYFVLGLLENNLLFPVVITRL